MFENFDERKQRDPLTRKIFGGVFAFATVFYVGSAGAILWYATQAPPPAEDKEVTVTFDVPEPPPPPEPEVKPEPPPAPMVSAPKHLKRMETPPPAPPPPTEIPQEMPKEAAPEKDGELRVYAAAAGEGNAAGSSYGNKDQKEVASIAPGPPAAPPRPKPIPLPENAVPPKELDGNANPGNEETNKILRETGKSTRVILRVLVNEFGKVEAAKVVRGEDPFAADALQKVKTWRFSPALDNGKPIAVFINVTMNYTAR